jgi:hypothetical protein
MSQLNKIFPMAYAKMTESVKLTMPDVVSPWGRLDPNCTHIWGFRCSGAVFPDRIELRHIELQEVRPEPVHLVRFCLSDQVYAKRLL